MTSHARLNPAELEIALFCEGLEIDASCTLEQDARLFSRTRAGLGSGLELIIPGDLKELWMNVPVLEPFVQGTSWLLSKEYAGYLVTDRRNGQRYPVIVPPEPEWYRRQTSRGTPMPQIGVLQGTYLGIYINNACAFWHEAEQSQCKFCTTGLNVGKNEKAKKELDDVAEVALAAKEESGVTFVHFNSGYQGGRDLDLAAPYAKVIKEQVGALVGMQLTPTKDLWKYDWLIDLGVDHFSFCYEFHNPEFFARLLPGKERTFGQETFFRAIEYTVNKLGKGTVSGEIIAGIEPIEDTLQAIDWITERGAFPTVCIFRPTIGSQMEDWPSPRYEDMVPVFRHVYEACRKHDIPIGLAPNIEVSLIVQPNDCKYLVPRDWAFHSYEGKLKLIRLAASGLFRRKLARRRIPVSATDPSAYMPKPAPALQTL